MTKKASKQGTTDEWKDSVGQTFRPGDLISVAIINGRSPQMVIARVDRINTTNPQGEPHVKSMLVGRVSKDYPRKEYIGPKLSPPDARAGEYRFAGRAKVEEGWRKYREERARLEAVPENWRHWTDTRMVPEYREVPNVTVTATPLLDGRGFHRSNAQQTWKWDEETGKGTFVTDPSKPKTRPVTYTLIGNIIKLPESLTEEDVAELAKDRGVEW